MDKRINLRRMILCLMLLVCGVGIAEPNKVQYMNSEEKAQWILSMEKMIVMSKRKVDPFGLSQDLTVKYVTQEQKAAVKSDAFSKAIKAMKIPMVLGNSFVIDSEQYKKGKTFSLERGGKSFRVRVISVNVNQITFKNIKTGELVVKKINMFPDLKENQGAENKEGISPANQGKGVIKLDE